MKRVLCILCALLVCLPFAACQDQQADLESDEYYIEKYAYPLHMNLGIGDESNYFSDPKELSPQKCVIAFAGFVQTENLYDEAEFWDAEREIYVIPIKTMEDVLERYLGDPLSDQLRRADTYALDSDAIETPVFSAFGGSCFPKIVSKEKQGDRLTLVVDFYDEAYTEVLCREQYVIDEKEEYYTLRSVLLCDE